MKRLIIGLSNRRYYTSDDKPQLLLCHILKRRLQQGQQLRSPSNSRWFVSTTHDDSPNGESTRHHDVMDIKGLTSTNRIKKTPLPLHRSLNGRKVNGSVALNGDHHHTDSDNTTIGRVILVRHGQSRWNVTDPSRGLTARFTGWADIGLTEQGKQQSSAVGRALKNVTFDGQPLIIDSAFCSLLSRARDTLHLMLKEMDLVADSSSSSQDPAYRIPVIRSWRLNERHYGALVGLSKDGAVQMYEKELLSQWRNSWSIPPPPMSHDQLLRWKQLAHCRTVTEVRPAIQNDLEEIISSKFFNVFEKPHRPHSPPSSSSDDQPLSPLNSSTIVSPPEMPRSESFKNVVERVLPIWTHGIAPRIRRGETVLIASHANTIRSMLFYLDPNVVTKDTIKKIKIESARPLVYEFRNADAGLRRRAMTGEENEVVIPGGLVLVKREKSRTKEGLNGLWIETDEIKNLSFCTNFGMSQLEHEIA